MKYTFLFLVLFALFICSCTNQYEGDNSKGLITFYVEPAVVSIDSSNLDSLIVDSIYFSAMIQYSGKGDSTEISYEISDENDLFIDGTMKVYNNIDSVQILWLSDTVYIYRNKLNFYGKTINIFLDPQHEKTLDALTTQSNIDLLKKYTFVVP